MWKTRAKVKARRSKKAIESGKGIFSVMGGRELGFAILFYFLFLIFSFF